MHIDPEHGAGSLPQLHSSTITDLERCLVGWDTYPFRDRASLVLRQREPVSVAMAARFSSAHRSTASTGLKVTVKPCDHWISTQQWGFGIIRQLTRAYVSVRDLLMS